jgi:hypothetical protein
LLDNIMDKKEGNTLDVTVIMHLNRVTLLGTSLQMLAVVLLLWVQMVLRQEKFSLQIKLRQVVHFTISH